MLAPGDARAHVRRRPAQRLDDPRQAPASPDHGEEDREDDSKAHGDLTHGSGPRILGPDGDLASAAAKEGRIEPRE